MKPALSLYFWFLFLSFFLAIVVVPFTIRIKINNWRKNNSISLEIKFLFFALHKTFGFSRFSVATQNIASRIFFFQDINSLFAGLAFFNRQLKALNWRYLSLKITIGNGNPAETALIAGSLLGTSGFLSRYLKKHYSFKKQPRFFIYPSFTARIFYFDLLFAFKTSVGRLLYTGIYLTAYLLAGRWLRNAGASNPGLNENSHGKLKRNGGC